MSTPAVEHEESVKDPVSGGGDDGVQQTQHAGEEEEALSQQQTITEEHDDYPEPETDLLPPPDFKPFFTLIEDTEHHHPTVHYIFVDDDPEILTEAALSTTQPNHSEERYVIVDMSADGKSVVSASSLSPDWQALTTKITNAPSWGGGADGLMLTIAGEEVREKRKKGGSVEGLLKAFDSGLGSLDGVLGREEGVERDTQVMRNE